MYFGVTLRRRNSGKDKTGTEPGKKEGRTLDVFPFGGGTPEKENGDGTRKEKERENKNENIERISV